jgi:hypothetical protein
MEEMGADSEAASVYLVEELEARLITAWSQLGLMMVCHADR